MSCEATAPRQPTFLQLHVHDVRHGVTRQLVEHDHVVQSVDELGREVSAYVLHDGSLDGRRDGRPLRQLRQQVAAEVGCQDDDGVLEVDDVPGTREWERYVCEWCIAWYGGVTPL